MTTATTQTAATFADLYGEGYRVGRGDVRFSAAPRVPLIPVPADMPGETGEQYAVRHLGVAWLIGYSRAYRFETDRRAS